MTEARKEAGGRMKREKGREANANDERENESVRRKEGSGERKEAEGRKEDDGRKEDINDGDKRKTTEGR